MRAFILDLETAPLPNASDYLDPVEAAKNLRDPDKIKADIERRQREQVSDCGLDWNLNRIVCAGLWGEDEHPTIISATGDSTEREILKEIAARLTAPRPQIMGFCIRRFDVPVILQRARYLGVAMPRISLKRYDNPHLIDLYDVLTFDEQPCTSVMRRSLTSFCRRFGIDVADEHRGADVASLVAEGNYDAIEAHCRADVLRVKALAERLGYLKAVEQAV